MSNLVGDSYYQECVCCQKQLGNAAGLAQDGKCAECCDKSCDKPSYTRDDIKALLVWPASITAPVQIYGKGITNISNSFNASVEEVCEFNALIAHLRSKPELDRTWHFWDCVSSRGRENRLVFDVLKSCPEIMNIRQNTAALYARIAKVNQDPTKRVEAMVLEASVPGFVATLAAAQLEYQELEDFPGFQLSAVAKEILDWQRNRKTWKTETESDAVRNEVIEKRNLSKIREAMIRYAKPTAYAEDVAHYFRDEGLNQYLNPEEPIPASIMIRALWCVDLLTPSIQRTVMAQMVLILKKIPAFGSDKENLIREVNVARWHMEDITNAAFLILENDFDAIHLAANGLYYRSIDHDVHS